MDIWIKFDNVYFSYNKHARLLENFSLKLEKSAETRSSVISLAGKSGCGKSTILKLAARLLKPTRGKIEYSSAQLRMAYLSQFPVLFDHLTIQENARYLMNLPHNRPYVNKEQFNNLAKKLDINDLIEANSHRQLKDLSGGERQRIALLQVVSVNPDVIFLDEPCTGLDSATKRDFLLSLSDLLNEVNTLAIYVSHHNDEVKLITDRLIYLGAQCRLLYDGPVDGKSKNISGEALQFLNHPFYNKLFVRRADNGELTAAATKQENDFREIGLLGDQLEYSDSKGLGYTVVKNTEELSIVKLNIPGSPTIIVKGHPAGQYINAEKAIVSLN